MLWTGHANGIVMCQIAVTVDGLLTSASDAVDGSHPPASRSKMVVFMNHREIGAVL